MEARFINGSTVNRVWRDGNTELVAAFQYENDAMLFARMKAEQDMKDELHTRYAVSCMFSGKLTFVPHEPSKKTAPVD